MYRKLRARMFEFDITQEDLRKLFKKSYSYITPRMTGKTPWSMDDVYKLCGLLKIPYDEITLYFPPRAA